MKKRIIPYVSKSDREKLNLGVDKEFDLKSKIKELIRKFIKKIN